MCAVGVSSFIGRHFVFLSKAVQCLSSKALSLLSLATYSTRVLNVVRCAVFYILLPDVSIRTTMELCLKFTNGTQQEKRCSKDIKALCSKRGEVVCEKNGTISTARGSP